MDLDPEKIPKYWPVHVADQKLAARREEISRLIRTSAGTVYAIESLPDEPTMHDLLRFAERAFWVMVATWQRERDDVLIADCIQFGCEPVLNGIYYMCEMRAKYGDNEDDWPEDGQLE